MDNASTITTIVLTILSAFIASSGFWAYILQRHKDEKLWKKLLLGLAHDRILFLSMQAINRGSISREEFNNLHEFIYMPYRLMGGNGTTTRMMDEVNKLPIKESPDS